MTEFTTKQSRNGGRKTQANNRAVKNLDNQRQIQEQAQKKGGVVGISFHSLNNGVEMYCYDDSPDQPFQKDSKGFKVKFKDGSFF